MLCGGLQVIASVLHSYVKVWFSHAKVLPGEADDFAVNFNAIYRNRSVDCTKLAGDGSGSQANHADAMYLIWREGWIIEIGGNHEIVPGTMCEQLLGIVDGVNA